MVNIVPTVGRVVLYRFTKEQAAEVNRRRAHAVASLPLHRANANGVQIHLGNDVYVGQDYPATVIVAHGATWDSYVNLKVHLDGTDDYWARSVRCGDHDGDYHWMVYQQGQAAKAEKAESDLAKIVRGVDTGTSPMTNG